MATNTKGWAITGLLNYAERDKYVATDPLPPEGWLMGWPELFDSTEYGMGEEIEVGLLLEPVPGFGGELGSVVVVNHTRRQLAIYKGGVGPVTLITVRDSAQNEA